VCRYLLVICTDHGKSLNFIFLVWKVLVKGIDPEKPWKSLGKWAIVVFYYEFYHE